MEPIKISSTKLIPLNEDYRWFKGPEDVCLAKLAQRYPGVAPERMLYCQAESVLAVKMTEA